MLYLKTCKQHKHTVFFLYLMVMLANTIQLHKVKLDLLKVHTIFFICAACSFT